MRTTRVVRTLLWGPYEDFNGVFAGGPAKQIVLAAYSTPFPHRKSGETHSARVVGVGFDAGTLWWSSLLALVHVYVPSYGRTYTFTYTFTVSTSPVVRRITRVRTRVRTDIHVYVRTPATNRNPGGSPAKLL